MAKIEIRRLDLDGIPHVGFGHLYYELINDAGQRITHGQINGFATDPETGETETVGLGDDVIKVYDEYTLSGTNSIVANTGTTIFTGTDGDITLVKNYLNAFMDFINPNSEYLPYALTPGGTTFNSNSAANTIGNIIGMAVNIDYTALEDAKGSQFSNPGVTNDILRGQVWSPNFDLDTGEIIGSWVGGTENADFINNGKMDDFIMGGLGNDIFGSIPTNTYRPDILNYYGSDGANIILGGFVLQDGLTNTNDGVDTYIFEPGEDDKIRTAFSYDDRTEIVTSNDPNDTDVLYSIENVFAKEMSDKTKADHTNKNHSIQLEDITPEQLLDIQGNYGSFIKSAATVHSAGGTQVYANFGNFKGTNQDDTFGIKYVLGRNFNGGGGNDWLDYGNALVKKGLNFDLQNNTVTTIGSNLMAGPTVLFDYDQFTGFEIVSGSRFGDVFYAAPTAIEIWGGGGEDTLDLSFYSDGVTSIEDLGIQFSSIERFIYGSGNDVIDFEASTWGMERFVDAGGGQDTLTLSSGTIHVMADKIILDNNTEIVGIEEYDLDSTTVIVDEMNQTYDGQSFTLDYSLQKSALNIYMPTKTISKGAYADHIKARTQDVFIIGSNKGDTVTIENTNVKLGNGDDKVYLYGGLNGSSALIYTGGDDEISYMSSHAILSQIELPSDVTVHDVSFTDSNLRLISEKSQRYKYDTEIDISGYGTIIIKDLEGYIDSNNIVVLRPMGPNIVFSNGSYYDNDRLFHATGYNPKYQGPVYYTDGDDSINVASLGSFYTGVAGGGAGNDTITGGSGNDSLIGGLGNDTLDGKDGWNSLYGGEGNDTLKGGSGNDTLYGDFGDDKIETGGGNDTIIAGSGDDIVIVKAGKVFNNDGGAGQDKLVIDGSYNNFDIYINSEGGNIISKTNPNFIVYFKNYEKIAFSNKTIQDSKLLSTGIDNTFYADLENERIEAGDGFDIVNYSKSSSSITINFTQNSASGGDAENDELVSVEGIVGSIYNDTLIGGTGNNYFEGDNGDDVLDGGIGIDTAGYASASAGVTVNLALTTNQNTGGAGTDTLAGFENLTGSAFNDILIGDTGNNVIDGGDGNDTIQGGLGNDTLIGGLGLDTVSYQAATAGVTVTLAQTTAQNTTNAGTDTLSGFENIIGSAYADTLIGDANANTIEGEAGNDVLDGGAGIDTASYSSAAAGVTVSLETLTAQNTVNAGTDTLINFENLTGSAYGDTLSGNTGVNILIGNAGNDTLKGRDGDDFLYGGDGADYLEGGNGNDILNGGIGADTFKGSSGTDTFVWTSLAEAGDTIQDFNITAGEKMDLMGIMQNISGFIGAQAFTDGYIQKVQNGTSTEVYVDLNGSAVSGGQTLIATLQNVTATSLSLTSFILPVSVPGGNTPPVAQNDSASTNEDTAVTVTVLANDSDANGNPLSVSVLTGVAHGTLQINGNNTITYTPTANYFGTDSFTYQVNDGQGGIASATVSLTVNSVNDAPLAIDDTFTGTQNTNITGNLLSNNGNGIDSDLDGDTLNVTAQTLTTAHGSVVISANGSFTYTPTTGYTGTDSFNYTVSDGNGGSDTGIVTLSLVPAVIMGTSGNDTLTGTASADWIFGLGGNDTIYGEADNDTLYGDSGDDTLKGRDGDDTMYGGDGIDYLEGGNGNDVLYGGIGVDTMKGSSGTDTFVWTSMTEAGDIIQDYNKTANEKLDISDLLTGYDPLTSLITDFVQITDNGTNSFLAVDTDGAVGGSNFIMLATLNAVTGITDEAAQLAAGRLVVV